MSNVIQINLPKPSINLISTVKQFAESYTCDPDKKRWLDEWHGNEINSVLHHFDSPDWLTKLIQKEYEIFFSDHCVGGMLGIMKNAKDTPACLPPHCDRSRAVGLNYFIELGGNDVKTVFYDRTETITGVSTNIPYKEITPIEEHQFKQSWYCCNVNRCHSVENIESTRLWIAIRLVRPGLNSSMDFEYSMADFQKDYPTLCVY